MFNDNSRVHLIDLNPNSSYDINYLEENNDISVDPDITQTLRKNIISFEFDDERLNQGISNNIINIDNIQYKRCELGVKKFDFLAIEVNLKKIKKNVLFYSPGLIKNKTTYSLYLIIRNKNKDLTDYICFLDKNEVLGIPYEYLDGTLYFINAETNEAYHVIELASVFENPNQPFKEEIQVSDNIKYIINKKKYKVY